MVKFPHVGLGSISSSSNETKTTNSATVKVRASSFLCQDEVISVHNINNDCYVVCTNENRSRKLGKMA